MTMTDKTQQEQAVEALRDVYAVQKELADLSSELSARDEDELAEEVEGYRTRLQAAIAALQAEGREAVALAEELQDEADGFGAGPAIIHDVAALQSLLRRAAAALASKQPTDTERDVVWTRDEVDEVFAVILDKGPRLIPTEVFEAMRKHLTDAAIQEGE